MKFLAVICVAGLVSVDLGAQATDIAGRQRFEVASVKRNESGDGGMTYRVLPGGNLVMTNFPLAYVISMAYESKVVLNKPSWVDSARYDINAKVTSTSDAGRISLRAMLPMLQLLLEDRFGLAVRRGTKGAEAWALLRRAALGPGLRVSTSKCAVNTTQTGGASGLKPPAADDTSQCGLKMDAGQLRGRGQTLTNLARTLQIVLGEQVIDRTALEGVYDFELTWAEDTVDIRSAVIPPAPSSTAPSLFTALPEQLGLTLAREQISEGTVIIERIADLTPN